MLRILFLSVLVCFRVPLIAQIKDNTGKNAHLNLNKADDSLVVLDLINKAGAFDISNILKLDSSLYYLNEALLMAQEKELKHYIYKIWEQYNRVFLKSGNYTLALEYSFKMLQMLDEEMSEDSDTNSLNKKYASLYTQIGNCYFNMDNFKCLDYYRRSLDYVKRLAAADPAYPATERELMIYNNIGSAYLSNYNFIEAEKYFEKALELNKTVKSPITEGSLFNNLGIVSKEKKDFTKAFEYYGKALQIRSNLEDSVGMAQTYNNLGDAYFLTGEYDLAIGALNKALQISKQTGSIRSEMKAANFLSIAYEKTGDYLEALQMSKLYTFLHDSINSDEKMQNAIRLEMQYQHEKQVKENELQQQIILAKKERKILIFMIACGVLLFSVTILILLYRNQRMRMRQAEIEKEKLELELEFRNKELSTHVMYLLRKNEFIASIFNKLLELKSGSMTSKENEAWIQDLMREIQSNIDHTVWNEFEIRFQQVHKDFYRNLSDKFPDLTPNEIKICAFLKLNMTTKDISAITFQSVKSIQVARNRLRKKMGIEREENLVALLQQF